MPPTKDHEACPFARRLDADLCFPVVPAGACDLPHVDRTIGTAHRDERRHRHVKVAPAAAATTAEFVSVRQELAECIGHDWVGVGRSHRDTWLATRLVGFSMAGRDGQGVGGFEDSIRVSTLERFPPLCLDC